MRHSEPRAVIGKDGLTGVLLDPLPSRIAREDVVRVRVDDGRVIELPADMVVVGSDGTYLIPVGPEDIRQESSPAEAPRPVSTNRAQTPAAEQVVPVLAEELVVEKKPVVTGGVRVNRRVLEHDETVEVPLLKEQVDVRRVVIDREVDGPLPVRREGETTVIPIVEEVLVVEKRYRLKEEIHVSRTVREEVHRERVTVRRQEAEVEQYDSEGRARTVRSAAVPPAPVEPKSRPRRRSFLRDD